MFACACVVNITFSSNVTAGPLWSIYNIELEVSNLTFVHSVSSKGVFIGVFADGKLVIDSCIITDQTAAGYEWMCIHM
jgi:hypothetical protein